MSLTDFSNYGVYVGDRLYILLGYTDEEQTLACLLDTTTREMVFKDLFEIQCSN